MRVSVLSSAEAKVARTARMTAIVVLVTGEQVAATVYRQNEMRMLRLPHRSNCGAIIRAQRRPSAPSLMNPSRRKDRLRTLADSQR